MSKPSELLSKNIMTLLEKKGWNQADLAREMGVPFGAFAGAGLAMARMPVILTRFRWCTASARQRLDRPAQGSAAGRVEDFSQYPQPPR